MGKHHDIPKSYKCNHKHHHYHKNDNKNKQNSDHVDGQVKLVNYHKDEIRTKEGIKEGTPDSIWVMGSPIFWASGNRGEGVKIAIIDTGIDSSHPALANRVVKRKDYVNDGASPSQFDTHATHVAGTIAANNSNLKGVAYGVSLYDYRVLDKNGSGTFSAVTQAINDAVKDGCHIISMSLGGSSSYQPMRNAIINAKNKNVLVIVAAGNEGPNKISYPANYPEVLSVGAVQYDFPTGTLTTPSTPWFSNTNSEVDVCADGWQVYSCMTNNRYGTMSGTSMAAPHIAGFAALVRNKLKEKLKRDPTYSEMYLFMKVSTLNVPSLNKNNLMGAGFVTLYPEFPKKLSNGTWTLPNLSF